MAPAHLSLKNSLVFVVKRESLEQEPALVLPLKKNPSQLKERIYLYRA